MNKIKSEMNWLYDANPAVDIEVALKNKDYKFIGIYGAKLIVPNININCINREKDIKPIKGTTDAVLGYEHAKLIAIAVTYAEYYNFRMMMYLIENNDFKCKT